MATWFMLSALTANLVCLKVADGQEVWRRSFPNDFQGKMHSGWGYSESPLVDGDKVVCTPGGPEAGIVALNKKTGDEIWRVAIPPIGDRGGDGAAYSSIVISHGAGVKQYVQLMGRGVVGVEAEKGKFLWGYNPVANRYRQHSHPAGPRGLCLLLDRLWHRRRPLGAQAGRRRRRAGG